MAYDSDDWSQGEPLEAGAGSGSAAGALRNARSVKRRVRACVRKRVTLKVPTIRDSCGPPA